MQLNAKHLGDTVRCGMQVAAEMHGLSAENFVAVNGGDELLRLVLTSFVEAGMPRPAPALTDANAPQGILSVLPREHASEARAS